MTINQNQITPFNYDYYPNPYVDPRQQYQFTLQQTQTPQPPQQQIQQQSLQYQQQQFNQPQSEEETESTNESIQINQNNQNTQTQQPIESIKLIPNIMKRIIINNPKEIVSFSQMTAVEELQIL